MPNNSENSAKAFMATARSRKCSMARLNGESPMMAHNSMTMFGDSDPACWHPWQVNYQVLQPASREVNALSSSEVYDAFAHTITQ